MYKFFFTKHCTKNYLSLFIKIGSDFFAENQIIFAENQINIEQPNSEFIRPGEVCSNAV